jgi:dihydrofolate reductase
MITIVAALTKDGVIGKENALPWSIPEELAHFRQLTQGHTVIMGRKTFEAIGQPLSERWNIVLSRTKKAIPGVEVCSSVNQAIKSAAGDVFIIGGGQIFKQTIGLADRLVLSHIKKSYAGDVFFPKFDGWKEIRSQDKGEFVVKEYSRDNRNTY